MSYRGLSIGILLLSSMAGSSIQIAHASTTVDYTSPCYYFDTVGVLQAATTCHINAGTLGAGGGSRYIVRFPNEAEVVIYIDENGEAETNGISSDTAIAGGNIVVATQEGKILIFRSYRYE